MNASRRDDDRRAHVGSGQLRWDAGGWFGALFGCTLWMLLVAGSSASTPLVLGVGLGAFVAAWALGLWLWSRRERWSTFAALQLFMAVAGLLAACVLGAADYAGRLEALAMGWTLPVTPWLVLVVYPGLMLMFAWLELRSRRAAS
jgi:hypothetical protein